MNADSTERDGDELVEPLLRSWVKTGGEFLDTREARQRAAWQRFFGDYLFREQKGKLVSVEVKTERVYTGNLFVETWSNASPIERREGWLTTLKADGLVCGVPGRADCVRDLVPAAQGVAA